MVLKWLLRFIGINLYAWSRLPLALLPHPVIKKGDRFIAVEDIDATGLIYFHSPFTDGFKCVIPAGTILTAFHDSERVSLGFGCIPENKEQFEEMHVLAEIRKDPKYAGYSFVVRYSELGKKYKKI